MRFLAAPAWSERKARPDVADKQELGFEGVDQQRRRLAGLAEIEVGDLLAAAVADLAVTDRDDQVATIAGHGRLELERRLIGSGVDDDIAPAGVPRRWK